MKPNSSIGVVAMSCWFAAACHCVVTKPPLVNYQLVV